MLIYMKKQFNWAAHNKRMYIFLIICVLGCVLSNIAMVFLQNFYGDREGTYAVNMFMFAIEAFIVPYYLSFLIADMVFRDGYRKGHLKADMDDGGSKTQIYFGRFFLELVLTLIFVIAIMLTFWGCVYIFIGNDGTLDKFAYTEFLGRVVDAFPLWVAGVSISNMLFFAFKRRLYAFIGFLVIIVAIPQAIFHFAPTGFLSKILITPQFSFLPFYATREPLKYWIMGVVYSVLAASFGYMIFKKRSLEEF